MMAITAKALFISHGGGPLPLLGDAGHQEMVNCLQNIAARITKPSEIIVVSAHWEQARATITSGATPSLIYDYYGFADESYDIQYPCKGSPGLANEISEQLDSAGIENKLDSKRGFDHGLFIPLKIMFPEADIPCVQVSLLDSLEPAPHIALGQALQPLLNGNRLLIGSGFSFHNMKAFFSNESPESKKLNHNFEAWLIDSCSNDIPENKRTDLLTHWFDVPGARYCHPREEHLLPLHVCYGATKKASTENFKLNIMNKEASMYLW